MNYATTSPLMEQQGLKFTAQGNLATKKIQNQAKTQPWTEEQLNYNATALLLTADLHDERYL